MGGAAVAIGLFGSGFNRLLIELTRLANDAVNINGAA
jgi:hypothetical protein